MRRRVVLAALALAAAGCGAHGDDRHPRPTPSASARHCLGAAARAASAAPCEAEPPAGSIVPGLSGRALDPAAPCTPAEPLGLVAPCAFGAPDAQARLRFAVVGDSHAGQLRSAFAVLARAQGWRGYALSRNSCAYAEVGRPLPAPYFSQCVTWKRQVPQWLARHPEVSTVFVVGLTRDVGSPDPVASYQAAWKRLPASVTHLVVVRDTPEMEPGTMGCVSAALAQRREPGAACAVPRALALPPDPAVAAAGRLGLQTIDLTRYFCDARACYPVIGGVLVHKDVTHVTPTFARTLGPFLLAEVRRVAASWQ